MTPSGPTPDSEPTAQVHVADIVIARVAAYYARQVPGVAALQPDLAQSMLGLAGRMLGGRQDSDPALSTDGVDVDIDGQTARIEITAMTRLGYNCRDIAEAIQQLVAAQVAAHTGLTATVTVTITDIDLDTGERTGPGAPALRAVPG